MTDRLTLAELTELERKLADRPQSMTQSRWSQTELPALLAMARRLLEVESALAWLAERGWWSPSRRTTSEICAYATELGWKGLTP
jgi:hypothetical protein